MVDLWSLGRLPIQPERPAGEDVRYDADFEALQAEIDKLSTPSATDGTDWEKVERLAAEILAARSKDLLAAGYFAVAAIRRRGFEGFAQGLRVYADLLENFWEDLFPPRKRMRGRVGAVEWWLEKSEAALQNLAPAPLEPEMVAACRRDLERVDGLLRERLDAPPLTRPLERFIEGLTVKAPVAAPQTEDRPVPTPTSAADPPAAPVTAPAAPAPQPPARPAAAAGPAVSGALDEVRPASEVEAERLLRGALQAVRRVADYYHTADLADPRGYRWRRIAGWSMINALPPAVSGRTEIPPPVNHDLLRSEMQALQDKGNWEALVRAAEERFQGAVLWLDLGRFAAAGLAGMGPSHAAAREAVDRETLCLLERLPGVAELSFADGTPCADGATRAWLQGLQPERAAGPIAGAAPPDEAGALQGPDEELLQQARDLAGRRRLDGAVALLQEALRGSFSRRVQLHWRLALCEILMNAAQTPSALPQMEVLLQDVADYRLEQWEPELAVKVLKTVRQGFSASGSEALRVRAAEIRNRIARIDPLAALGLE